MEMELHKKLQRITDAIHATRGEDIIVYEFAALNPFIDYVVICSANNMRQVFAMANNIHDALREAGASCRMEGNKDSRWVLLDAKEIIVHVFLDEERDVYRLERLYSDLPRVSI